LIQHERALARLYLRCAAAFGERRDLWLALAADEHAHSNKLEGLRTDPDLDKWISSMDRLRSPAIRSSIGYVEAQASRAAEGGLTLVQALAVAKDLEDALIDRQLLLPVPSDPGAIGAVLAELHAETEGHRRRLLEALEVEGRK
jgi:hypothetical protein